ncbi:MAG: 50S ribosomal protein L17 [Gemmatimonadota bacterium]
MRHQVKGRHLGRTAEHRKALYKNLVTALFEHGRIRTTEPKAREVRPLAEKMITLGKRGDLHARRQAVRVVGNGPALERLFGPIAERFASRPGGYTRMIKAGRRVGDAAPLAYLELLEEAPRVVRAAGAEEEREEKKARGRGAKSAAAKAGESAKGRGKKAGATTETEKRTSRREAKAANPKGRGAGTPAQGEMGRKSRRGEAHPEDV